MRGLFAFPVGIALLLSFLPVTPFSHEEGIVVVEQRNPEETKPGSDRGDRSEKLVDKIS